MKPFLTDTPAGVKPNRDIPVPVQPIVRRQFENAINSDSSPGGYVRPEQFTALKRAGVA